MSEITQRTHQYVANTILSRAPDRPLESLVYPRGNVTAQVSLEGHDGLAVSLADPARNLAYWYSVPPSRFIQSERPPVISASVSYNTAQSYRTWLISGPGYRTGAASAERSGERSRDGGALILLLSVNQDGSFNTRERVSSNPDRTFRAAARLAKIVSVAEDTPAQP